MSRGIIKKKNIPPLKLGFARSVKADLSFHQGEVCDNSCQSKYKKVLRYNKNLQNPPLSQKREPYTGEIKGEICSLYFPFFSRGGLCRLNMSSCPPHPLFQSSHSFAKQQRPLPQGEVERNSCGNLNVRADLSAPQGRDRGHLMNAVNLETASEGGRPVRHGFVPLIVYQSAPDFLPKFTATVINTNIRGAFGTVISARDA